LLAPWVPYLELINHFRPYLIASSGVLGVLAWRISGLGVRRAGAFFFVLSLVLALLPTIYRARETAEPSFLRVVTFNLWSGAARPEETVRFLRTSNADIVLLQEAALAGQIVAALRDTYPYTDPCPDEHCEVRLLAKHPFNDAGRYTRSELNPPLTWARFDRDGSTYEVFGVHLAYPFHPAEQQAHVDWLSAHLAQRRHPIVLAGDLNLTPFSWKLAKLALSAGLRRHGTLLMSWPAHEWTPLFLLDNVLASPSFASIAIRTGPRLGSDHLPVIADLALVP
jgi:endonuclease/exonuclease/phosphatase (EEP) superfamily protein YafD